MTRNICAPAIVFLVFSLSSCSNLFTTNYFTRFDGPPSASDISYNPDDPKGYLDDLGEAMDSSRFFDDLNESDRDTLTNNLEDIYTDPSADPETVQEAALLAAELQLNGTSAGTTVNNVVDIFVSDSSGSAFEDPGVLLEGIIPESAAGDAGAIASILEDLVTAGNAYEAYGNSVSGGSDVSGEVAQNAAVAILVSTIVSSGSGGSTEDNIDALAAAIAGGSGSTNAIFESGGSFNGAGDAMTDAAAEGSALDSILSSSGFAGAF